jgi:hypothetical protein
MQMLSCRCGRFVFVRIIQGALVQKVRFLFFWTGCGGVYTRFVWIWHALYSDSTDDFVACQNIEQQLQDCVVDILFTKRSRCFGLHSTADQQPM